MVFCEVLSTPRGQVTLLGLIFLLVFTSYITIQAFASKIYGEQLASDVLTVLYASFTISCFLSPSVTNKIGSKRTMALGIIGYSVLVAASLVHMLKREVWPFTKYLVMFGGLCTGWGAACLWTGQGRLLLQYTELDGGRNGGKLFGLFWSLFNTSAVIGGFLAFGYFYKSDDTGSAPLYVVFLVLMLLGALSTSLLKTPTELYNREEKQRQEGYSRVPGDEVEGSVVTFEATRGGADEELSSESWWAEIRDTFRLFWQPQMLCLSVLFLTTGLNEPYQLETFGGRFFDKRTLGLAEVVFYGMQCIASSIIGAVLDSAPLEKRRQRSIGVLALLLLSGQVANAVAFFLEYSHPGPVTPVSYNQAGVTWPALVFALWGFSDVVMQVYAYWLMGVLFVHAKQQARAVGFYKMVTSAGWAVGFVLIPENRMRALHQLILTMVSLCVGVALALLALPSPPGSSRHDAEAQPGVGKYQPVPASGDPVAGGEESRRRRGAEN